jgi:hypothetical protein
MDNKLFHAWFSQEQKNICYGIAIRNASLLPIQVPVRSSCIYLTDDGKEIEITEVNDTLFDHSKNFKDSKYLGKVVKFLRYVRD